MFTQADIDNNLITYREDGTDVFSDTFTFTVSDPSGNRTANTSLQVLPVSFNQVVGPQIMYALTGHTEISQAQFDFHAQFVPQSVAFYTNVIHSTDAALGPFETLGLSLWGDPNFQSSFVSLSDSAFIQKAYTTVFGAALGAQLASTDGFGLALAISNWQKLYLTVPSVYPQPHQAALAAAFGDLVGIGNEVHSQLSHEALNYVGLIGLGQAPFTADLSHYLLP